MPSVLERDTSKQANNSLQSGLAFCQVYEQPHTYSLTVSLVVKLAEGTNTALFSHFIKKKKTKLNPHIIFHQLVKYDTLAPSSFQLSRSELFFWLSVPQHIPGKWSLLWVMVPILRPHRG